MKIKQIIFVAATFICSTAATAQNTYREALQEFYKAWTTPLLEEKIHTYFGDCNENTLEEFKEKFFTGQQDVVERMLPSFQDNVSEEDLRDLTKIYITPEGKRFCIDNFNLIVGIVLQCLMLEFSSNGLVIDNIDEKYSQQWHELFDTYIFPCITSGTIKTIYKSDWERIKNIDKEKWRTDASQFFRFRMKSGDALQNTLRIASQPCFHLNQTFLLGIERIIFDELAQYDKVLAANKDSVRFKERLLPLAKKGDADAQFEVGMAYLKGTGVIQSSNMAYAYIASAAEKNHVQALYVLAQFYEIGIGIDKDEEQAFQYYLKAAEQNVPEAMKSAAKRYEKGIGVEKNSQQAAYWNKKYKEVQK